MNKEEISAIAKEVVKIYFDENVSVKEAIELCRRDKRLWATAQGTSYNLNLQRTERNIELLLI